jgi:acyl-CoA thioesterase
MADSVNPNPSDVAQRMWSQDNASQSNGLSIVEVGAGRAVLQMTVVADQVNGLGICHGGLLFLLADSAMAFASNSQNQVAVAVSASVDFVRPARLGDHLTATAIEEFVGPRIGLTSVAVRNELGELVASFHGRTTRTGGLIIE